jgi:hypothetical protein
MDAYTFTADKHQWGLTPYVNVPWTLDRHLTLLEGSPTADMVGPFEDHASNVHTIRTHSSMFVPFELLEVLLGQEFTAREAYLAVYPILEDLYLIEVCLPLLEYLQVATTQPSVGNPHTQTLQDRLGRVNYPVRPAVLSQRRASIIYRQLLALRPSDTGRVSDSFTEGLSEGITNIASEMHADCWSRETRVSEASRRKTPGRNMGIATLMRSSFLPPRSTTTSSRPSIKS